MIELKIGDNIKTNAGGPYQVFKIENNMIWFKIKGGVGQTILSNVIEIIKNEN
jgi:hypothetical protein